MKLPPIQIAMVLIALVSIVATRAYISSNTQTDNAGHVAKHQPIAPDVSVMVVHKDNYTAHVTAYGEAKARYQLDMMAQVNGQIQSLSPLLEVGIQVKTTDVLAQIDDRVYQQALSKAKSAVAQARVSLLEEQRRGDQAKQEWQQSGVGGEPDSPLVFRLPQLALAQSKAILAEKTRATAQRDLDNTSIQPPFNGLVVSREVQLGQFVREGDKIASLNSTDSIEVLVPLSTAQWQLLPQTMDNRPESNGNETVWQAKLFNQENQHQWAGYVKRVEQHLNTSSRQRALIVRVDKPLEQEPPLYSGTFVQVDIQGKLLQQVWRIPASAISQAGEIWIVTSDNKLEKHLAEKQYEKGNDVYVIPPKNLDSAFIIKRPLLNYKAGMVVTAREQNQ